MKRLGYGVVKPVRLFGNRQGMALGMIMIFVLAVSILGGALITASGMSAVENSRYLNSVKAFWLADAGVQKYKGQASAVVQNFSGFTNTVGDGEMQVRIVALSSNLVESVGVVQGVVQKIQFRFAVLPTIYEKAIYGANVSGIPWAFTLRGKGNPVNDVGGRDVVMGDVFVNGNVNLYEQSIVSNAPAPNTYSLLGDVKATGSISNDNTATIRGGSYPNSPTNVLPDLLSMNYAVNNTWDVAKEFQNAGITSGNLPVGHPLRDVVVKNPSNRAAQNNSTTNADDYYFEPMNANNNGANQYQANTPLNLSPTGSKTVYYVDGHVWVNNLSVYGFSVSGSATIAATRDIHISDNLKYATGNDLLGLVAVGTYNSSGQLISGGNIYFGDPTYGTLYTADAFMLAANNFYYNTSANNPSIQNEPQTGFQVYGNYAAMNQVNVYRDWYQYPVSTNGSGKNQVINYATNAAWFNPSSNRWQDVVSGNLLSSSQTNTLRHYQMIVKYDERIRNQATQPPGLPGLQTGTNGIYKEIYDWKLYPY